MNECLERMSLMALEVCSRYFTFWKEKMCKLEILYRNMKNQNCLKASDFLENEKKSLGQMENFKLSWKQSPGETEETVICEIERKPKYVVMQNPGQKLHLVLDPCVEMKLTSDNKEMRNAEASIQPYSQSLIRLKIEKYEVWMLMKMYIVSRYQSEEVLPRSMSWCSLPLLYATLVLCW